MRLFLVILLSAWSLNSFSKNKNEFHLDDITQQYSKYIFPPLAFLPANNPEQAKNFCIANGFKSVNSTESKVITKETLLAYGATYVRQNMFFTYSIILDFRGKSWIKVTENPLADLNKLNYRVYTYISCS